ncbi:uncharacterized protein LOC105424896 isoform X2 [Pogonomyrmex barbatus]|uniref:Uncharacterized protein LOC105424896 isoform X2 n=1 Tax=Pogonomyrmex barbatus TaxID=144034 RepID=A0A8N1S5W2_9HYME|nr:uncharacterized protein LOC105424896 isoform X2 [Pogonomyrmex barbatus]
MASCSHRWKESFWNRNCGDSVFYYHYTTSCQNKRLYSHYITCNRGYLRAADTLPSSSSSTSKCTKSISMLTESKLRSTNTNIESFVIKTSIANRKNLTYK